MHRLADLMPEGVLPRSALVSAASATSVKRWLRTGDVVRLQPGVVGLPGRADEWAVRARAATAWAGGPLSHLSALRAVSLVTVDAGPIHVTVTPERCPRGGSEVVVHRSDRRLVTVRRGTVEVTAPERSLVDAWTWSHSPGRNARSDAERPPVRQALIGGIRSGEIGIGRVRATSRRLGAHAGRTELAALLDLLAAGCQSELEIWGVQRVLPGRRRCHRTYSSTGSS